jgi:hypothetical protein
MVAVSWEATVEYKTGKYSWRSGETVGGPEIDQVVMAKSGEPFSLRAVSNAARSWRVTRGHQSRRRTSSFPRFN